MSDVLALPRRRDWFPYLVAFITIVVLGLFLVAPLVQTVISAFLPRNAPLALGNLTLENFRRFIEAANYRSAFVNSLLVSVLSTVIATALALPAAYAVARIKMRFTGVILALWVIPIVSPPFIGAYSWIVLLGRNGIISHYLNDWFGMTMPSIYGLFGVVLALSVNLVPYVFLIVQGALSAGDSNIEESARIMGASRWRMLRTVTFPLVTPAIGAAAVIVFIKALGNFGVPAILGGEMYVLPTLIYFQVHGFFNLNGAAAIALVNVLLTLFAIVALAYVNRRRRFVTIGGTARRLPRLASPGARIFANVYVWALLAVTVIPEAMVVWYSFAERWAGTVFPTVYGFNNYVRAASSMYQAVENSFLLAGLATAMAVVFGALLAYTSARGRFVGKWALDLTVMLPFVLPGVVTGVAFLATFNDDPLFLTGSGAILVLAYFTRRIAYVFRASSSSIAQIDPKIEEASTVCGATWGTTLRRVTVPLMAPGIAAGAIIVFATLVTEMSVTVLLYSARWKTLAIAIFERLLGDEMPLAAALGSVAIALTLALVYGASRLVGRSMADMFK